MSEGAPAGWRLRPDGALRVRRGAAGSVLLGGAPLRVLTLTGRGAAIVDAWLAGAPVGDDPAQGRLARRLLDAGLVHPDPPPAGDGADVTVVVPVHRRAEELQRCLAALDGRAPAIVVDDGSPAPDAAAIARVAEAAGAALVRLDPGRGPSAARNAGARAARTPFVAFVDSDCVVGPGFPGRLRDHLSDPALAVAAPRIVALEDGPGALARYEARRSALDMGPRPGLVAPGSPIPYVPSAAFVARAAALENGFDEALAMGEDVDLLWRLRAAGWQVRLDPSVEVAHDHRVRPAAWLRRRIAYNASAAPLEARHPGTLPAVAVSPAGAATFVGLAAGRPAVAAVATAGGAAALARRLHGRVPHAPAVAARLVLRGELHEAIHVARALTGPWLPLLLAATAARPALGRRLWTGIALAGAAELARPRDGLRARDYVLPRAGEDLARCAGVWLGCVRERHLGALLPRLRR